MVKIRIVIWYLTLNYKKMKMRRTGSDRVYTICVTDKCGVSESYNNCETQHHHDPIDLGDVYLPVNFRRGVYDLHSGEAPERLTLADDGECT